MQCTPHCVLTISEQCLASLIVLDSPFSILCVFALSSFVSWVKSIQSADFRAFDSGSKKQQKEQSAGWRWLQNHDNNTQWRPAARSSITRGRARSERMVCPSAHRLGSRGTGLYRGQVEKTNERQRLRLLGTGWWTLFRAPVFGLVTFGGPPEKLLQASKGEEKDQVPGARY